MILYLLFALPTTVAAQSFNVVSLTQSELPITDTARFSCTFTNQWSSTRHPIDYPGNAHWSPPVLLTHASGYNMWGPGDLATRGVESVAETGVTGRIEGEINSSTDTGDFVIGSTQFNSNTQEQTFASLAADADHPMLSTITMIAPSPDWFSGFYDFELHDGENWYSNFSIDSFPWDAGTEMGDTFVLSNPAENPHVPIFQLTEDSVPETGVFLNAAGTTVLPVANWQCKLTNAPEPTITDTLPYKVVSSTVSDVPVSETASYSCRFINMWNSFDHPTDYPSNAHWSPPVLATHGCGYQMWGPDVLATPGLELVAETGGTRTIRSELEASADVGDYVTGSIQFNSNTQEQSLPILTADADHPELSTVTMIAPSPDWFSGFFSFQLHDGTNWYSEFSIDSYPWDAGTETEDTYSGSNPAENRHIPIFQLTADSVPDTDVFLSANGMTVLPVANWECTLLTS